MTKYNPNIHHRRSIRLKGYDYSKAGLYFITICCKDRNCLFGYVENGGMNLNLFGQIAYEEWLQTEQIRDNCVLHVFIIMPNHIHGIIEISFKKGGNEGNGKFQSPSQTIGSFIRGFKIATIKKIKDKIISTGESQFAHGEFTPEQFIQGEFTPEQFIHGEFTPEQFIQGEFTPEQFIQEEFARKAGNINSISGESRFAPTRFAPTASIEKIKELNFKIWQRNYYENIIRDHQAYQNISNYIINNPAKWAEDKFHKK